MASRMGTEGWPAQGSWGGLRAAQQKLPTKRSFHSARPCALPKPCSRNPWGQGRELLGRASPDVTTGQASGIAEPLPPGSRLPQRKGLARDLALGLKTKPSPRFTPWASSRCCVQKRLCCQRGVLCAGWPRWHPTHSLGGLETSRCARTLWPPGPVARPRACSLLPSGTQDLAGIPGAALDWHGLQEVQGSAQVSPGHLLTSLGQAAGLGTTGGSTAQTRQHKHP